MATPSTDAPPPHVLLPVLPLGTSACSRPPPSAMVLTTPAALRALDIASRTGGTVLAVALREDASGPRDVHEIGTIARVVEDQPLADGGRRVELDGLRRARRWTCSGWRPWSRRWRPSTKATRATSGDPRWRRSRATCTRTRSCAPSSTSSGGRAEPMAWVNLACQHLPIAATARQRLLECAAADRCVKIGRGLDALLRKEHAS